MYPAGLRGDYSVQYRAKLPAQRILQSVLGHENRAAVMRYHLPHEVRGYAAVVQEPFICSNIIPVISRKRR